MAAAVLAALIGISFATGGAAQAPEVAVDADPAGNAARSIQNIDSCVSAAPGETVEVDVVLLEPGLGAAGLSGFEYRLFFNPDIVWVQAEDPRQLLDQASGSSPFPVSDPVPNDTGEFLSAAVDFGRPGVEPEGSSENGGGVIARLTLLARSPGTSNLRLQGVSLVDANDAKVTPAIREPAKIVVGGECTPAAATATAQPAGQQSATGGTTTQNGTNVAPPGAIWGTFVQVSAAAAPIGGGRPPADSGNETWLMIVGLIAAGAGAALVAWASVKREGNR